MRPFGAFFFWPICNFGENGSTMGMGWIYQRGKVRAVRNKAGRFDVQRRGWLLWSWVDMVSTEDAAIMLVDLMHARS